MSIEFTVYCDCGEALDEIDTKYTQSEIEIIVKPCETCAEENRKTGYDEGTNDE